MDVTIDQINVKDIRDKLVTKKALNEQNRQRASQSIETIKRILGGLEEDKISLIMEKGINVRGILAYDLDRVSKDKEYHLQFITEFGKVLSELKELLLVESGD